MPAKRHLLPVTALLAALVVQAGGAAPAGAQESPAASVDKVGWWNVTRGPQADEPDNPLRPALAPVPAAPTNVPADSLGVGAGAGEPTKVAAIGILLEGAPGAIVDRLTLTLKESPAPGANLGPDQAALVACPITGFWGETRNGDWINRPEADCQLASAAGTRAADGTWTFDLAAVATAAQWLDPSTSTGQNGVLVSEAVDAPSSFEASFLDAAAGGVTVDFAASGGGDLAADPFAAGDAGSATSDGFALSPVDADLGRTDPFAFAPADVPATPGAASPAGSPDETPASAATARPAAATSGRTGDLVGNLSWPTLLLIPLALALALVLSLTLGASDAPPATGGAVAGRRRLGGVSRALARLTPHQERP